MSLKEQGGVSCVSDDETEIVLALPVAGLMSNEDGYKIAMLIPAIDTMAKNLGFKIICAVHDIIFYGASCNSAFKLSDIGLFDGDKFSFV